MFVGRRNAWARAGGACARVVEASMTLPEASRMHRERCATPLQMLGTLLDGRPSGAEASARHLEVYRTAPSAIGIEFR